MERLINKISLINNNSSFTFKDNYNISKINVNKDYINIFSVFRFIEYLNNASYFFNRNNNWCPSLTDYNLNNDNNNNIFKPKRYKDFMAPRRKSVQGAFRPWIFPGLCFYGSIHGHINYKITYFI